MKTSNKILFGGLAFILASSIFVMAAFRSTATFWSLEECNELTRKSKTLNLEFEEVEIGHNIKATLAQGDFKVEIDAVEEIMNHLNHHVENGVLFLNLGDNVKDMVPCPTNVTITCPQLNRIKIANGSQIRNSEIFETPNLDIRAVNGSQVELSLEAESLKASASNSSNIEIAGELGQIDLSAKNSSHIQLTDALGRTAKVYLANSSTAMINVDTISNADLGNSSNLIYAGETVLGKMNNRNSSSFKQVGENDGHIIWE